MFKLGSVIVDYEANTKPFEEGIKSVNSKIQESGKSADNAGDKLTRFGSAGQRAFAMTAGAGGAGLLLGALGQVIGEARRFNEELDDGLGRARGQLNLTADETETLNQRAKDAYTNGWGASIGETVQLLGDMQMQIKGLGKLSDEEFAKVSGVVLAITDVFTQDNQKVSQAVNTLMEKFGVSATDATTMITAGFQNGLDTSGDFLDTINEYSVNYAEAGASANQFFDSLAFGQQAGILGTDKIADSFKEFTIRISDGSKLTQDSLDAINLGNIPDQIASGEITVVDAYQKISGALADIENPITRNQTAVGLLGTQYEDLGQSAESLVAQSDLNTSAWENNTEAVDTLMASYDTTTLSGEALARQLEVTKAEAFEPLTDAINQTMLKVFEFMTPIVQNKELMVGLATAVAILAVGLGLLSLVMAVTLIPTMWATAVAGWAMITPFIAIVAPILAVIAIIALLWWAFNNNFMGIKDIVNNAFKYITDTAFPALQQGFANLWGKAQEFGRNIANVFNALKDAVGNAMKFVANSLVGSFNFQIRGINMIIDGANKLPNISIPRIPTIPTFARGTRNFEGGFATINDGVNQEALTIGDTLYLPTGSDVINGSETAGLLNKDTGGGNVVMSLVDITTPMIRNWINQNLSEFKKAGIVVN